MFIYGKISKVKYFRSHENVSSISNIIDYDILILNKAGRFWKQLKT